MHLPPPRVREVLSVLGDLNPAEARALLSEVVATLDAAEMLALRRALPPQATKYLPHCVGAATVMNTEPMPWEFVEPPAVAPVPKGPTTQELIASTLPRTDWKPRFVAAGAIAITALTVFLAWPAPHPAAPPEPEREALVPLPPKQPFAEIPMVPAATARPVARKAEKAVKPERRPAVQKAEPASDLKRPAEVTSAPPPRKAGKSAPNEWASPFERRQ